MLQIRIAKASLLAAESELASLEARTTVERAKYLEGKPDDEVKSLAQAASKTERQAGWPKPRSHSCPPKSKSRSHRPPKTKTIKVKKPLPRLRKTSGVAKGARCGPRRYQSESDEYTRRLDPSTSFQHRPAAGASSLDRQPAEPTYRAAWQRTMFLWSWHFGRGLVPSMDEFGQNRKEPSHPALLDWLAAELMQPSIDVQGTDDSRGGWSMKHLHRLIVTSNTYRTASTNDAESYAIDPDTRYFWWTTPRCAEAEVIRDSR